MATTKKAPAKRVRVQVTITAKEAQVLKRLMKKLDQSGGEVIGWALTEFGTKEL